MNDGKVIALPGHITGQREVRDDVIKMLENLLDEARSGALIGVVYAAGYFDERTSYASSGKVARQILGALTLAQADLVDTLRE